MFLKIIIICLIAIIIFILSFFLGCHLNKKHEEHNAAVNFTASIHTTTILNTTANTVATEEEKTEKEKEQEEKSEEQEDKNEEKANPQVEAITSVVEVKTSITENKVPVTEEKESKKCNCCIIKTLLSVLLFIGIYFALILILPTSSFETLVFIFIAYLLFVLVVKSLIGAIVTRKEKDTLFHYKSVFDIPDTFYLLSFLFISPDYYITYLIKAKIEGIEKNDNGETAKQLRSVYIQANNIFNIIFTCLLAILSYVWIQCGLGNVITLYYILFVRIVSRTIEIILSFVLDVISVKNKKSNLRFPKRCLLAIISLFEVLMLSFVVFYVGCYCGMVGSLVPADDVSFTLSSILSNFFKMEELDYSLQFLKYMIDFTCFSLLGIVITSYIGEKKN